MGYPHISIHNHPDGIIFSQADIDHFIFSGDIEGIIVVGNNGNIYTAVYDYDDPILWTLDRKAPEGHLERQKATMAKKLLEQDEREKRAAGLPLEPESIPARQEAAKKHP